MSFQNFRLDSISVQSPSYAPSSALASASGSTNTIQDAATRGAQRGPYGSGDMDDGYTLLFDNLEAFQAWREKEEEEKVVEFVKGDTRSTPRGSEKYLVGRYARMLACYASEHPANTGGCFSA